MLLKKNKSTSILENFFKNKISKSIFLLNQLKESEKIDFINYISKSRIENFIATKLKEHSVQLNDDFIEKELQIMSSKRAIRTAENIRFAKLLSIELQKENIEHFYLKGFALQKYIYNDFSIRPLSDFDIFINLKDVKKTLEILKGLNFNTGKWNNLKEKNFILYANPNLAHNIAPAKIDIHTNIFKNKATNELFLKDCFSYLKKNDAQEPIYCIESLFIHLLYHGTSHSSYNVGPMFIMDLMHMINSNKLCWDSVGSKISRYKLDKEFTEINIYIKSFFGKSLIKKDNNTKSKIAFSDMTEILLSPPENSSLFIANKQKGFISKVRVIYDKLFNKEQILLHNNQKFTFIIFLQNFYNKVTRHFFALFEKNSSIKASKNRYKILRND